MKKFSKKTPLKKQRSLIIPRAKEIKPFLGVAHVKEKIFSQRREAIGTIEEIAVDNTTL